MGTHGAQRKTLALAVAGALLGTGFAMAPEAKAAGFIDDSTLTGGIYYWQRERDRKDLNPDSKDYNQYTTNLSHSTANLSLDFASGYAWDMFGLDVGAFTAIELAESSASGHPNEIAFSSKNRTYDEDYSGDKGGVSLYKAAAKFKYGPVWARAGYIQPSGQTRWRRTGALCRAPIRGRSRRQVRLRRRRRVELLLHVDRQIQGAVAYRDGRLPPER